MRQARFFILLASVSCGSTPTSSGDAGVDAVASPPEPFCKSRPNLQFCDDFDDKPLPSSFTDKSELGGTLTVDEVTASSPTRSLLVTTTMGSAETRLVLSKTFAAGKKLRLFGQIYVDKRGEPSSSLTEVYSLTFVENGAPYRVGIRVSDKGAWSAFEEGATAAPTSTVFDATKPVPDRVWTSLRLDVDFEAQDKGTLSVKIGSDTVVEKVALRPPFITAGATLGVGLRSGTPTAGEWRVRFDTLNFQID